MNYLKVYCALVFLLGSIPVGLLVGILRGVDVRSVGSGNIGATNVKRALGKKAGALTLALDALKGIIAVTLCPSLAGSFIASSPELPNISSDPDLLLALSGFLVVLGHCFSIFLKGRGGKGVATSLGVFSVIVPFPTAVAALIFLVTVKVKKYVALGSILAAVSLTIMTALEFAGDYSLSLKVGVAATAAIVVFRHAGNIKRLLAGTELAH